MYNLGMNNYIKENFVNLKEETLKIESFFNNIALITQNLSDIMDTKFSNNDIENIIKSLSNIDSYSIQLSIVVICKDEERCIERCIESIIREKNNNDELIILDTGSKDNTLNILKNNFADIEVYNYKWNSNFSEIRNEGIKLAKSEWVFFIDADEYLEKDSLNNLKEYLKIIKFLNIKNLVIGPTIINSDSHIVFGVKRILNKKDNINFYGLIHEEPRNSLRNELNSIKSISFSNVILHHDGYTKEIISQKKKIIRNSELLKKMIELEPTYPRWLYFYCRDSKSILTKEEYVEGLNKVVLLCGTNKYFEEYKIRALSNLTEQSILDGNLHEAEKFIEKLKEIAPSLSDVAYFDSCIKLIYEKYNLNILLNDLIIYRNKHQEIAQCSMHSNNFHIDLAIANLFFELGEYEKAFNIYSKLNENDFGEFKNKYKVLYKTLKKYFNE
ncbi:glycosyltransferase [Clostridium perfringens]|uniref:glycosyltransferase n=1 Tax=Clostridium perfringens TaxID=1502 RepID=UPI0010945A13|nr:glycosyltransferase [Clostridium perfringens]MDK0651533.1 glycosyltransferase [Clostridium perfringens]MDM0627426.1 glycosyltransferase [Clostridium perfringens]TGY43041.1 glycosyltransferase [Clostridium perfringens]